MGCVKSAHDLRYTCVTFFKAPGAADEQIRINIHALAIE